MNGTEKENLAVEGHKHMNNKRSPTTPITPSLRQPAVRRKIERIPNKDMIFNQPKDVIHLEYENWLLKKRVNKNEEIIKFRQLETQFHDGSYQSI